MAVEVTLCGSSSEVWIWLMHNTAEEFHDSATVLLLPPILSKFTTSALALTSRARLTVRVPGVERDEPSRSSVRDEGRHPSSDGRAEVVEGAQQDSLVGVAQGTFRDREPVPGRRVDDVVRRVREARLVRGIGCGLLPLCKLGGEVEAEFRHAAFALVRSPVARHVGDGLGGELELGEVC